MADKIFPAGLRAFKPNEKAPGFVKANITVNKQELIQWLQGQPDSLKLTLKESNKGTYYLELDTYQGTAGATRQPSQPVEDIPFTDLPF